MQKYIQPKRGGGIIKDPEINQDLVKDPNSVAVKNVVLHKRIDMVAMRGCNHIFRPYYDVSILQVLPCGPGRDSIPS